MANFNFKTTENYNEETIREFVADARVDFANNHADNTLVFWIHAIGRDEDGDITDYDDILADWEPARETVWQMVQHAVVNFTVNDDVDTDTETVEITLEACYCDDEEGVCCFASNIIAVSERQHRTRAEIIDDIIEYFENDTDAFTEIIEDCDDYDGFLEDDRWYSTDELEDVLDGRPIVEILNMAKFGEDLDDWHYDSHGEKVFDSFNPCRDWFRFDGAGNLESSNWKDYSDKIDRWAVEEIEENRGHLTSIDDYDELNALFDELDEAEA